MRTSNRPDAPRPAAARAPWRCALARWLAAGALGAAALGAAAQPTPRAEPSTGIAPPPRVTASPAPRAPVVFEGVTLPAYRITLPPGMTLMYDVSRSGLHGRGELRWQPKQDRYELRLETKLAGLTLLDQASRGVFDASGLAPVTYTDTRLRKTPAEATFDRATGQVGWKGKPETAALAPGAQDRLSWLVQLAGIVAAQPALRRPGAQVVMQVVGAHGDPAVWTLRCAGTEGTVLRFVREPEGEHGTEAWLDPKLQYLPVKATFRSGRGDDAIELRLLESSAGGPK